MITEVDETVTSGVHEVEPTSTDPSDLLIAVDYSGVNYKDVMVAAVKSRVRQILTAAGFSEPRETRLDFDMLLGESLEEAAEQATSMGAASRALRDQPEATVQKARTSVRAALKPHVKAGRVQLPGAVWLVDSANA